MELHVINSICVWVYRWSMVCQTAAESLISEIWGIDHMRYVFYVECLICCNVELSLLIL